MNTRLLEPGDEAAVEVFLASRAATSMFLRSNIRTAGLVYRDAPFHGLYVGAFEGHDLVGVVAHVSNGTVLVQADEPFVGELARAATEHSGRPVRGLSGPWLPCVAARHALGLGAAETTLCSREDLFALSLDALVAPPLLTNREALVRAPHDDELDALSEWRLQYVLETHGVKAWPAVVLEAREAIERSARLRSLFVLERDHRPVAMVAFNARLADAVQIGGVWTPPALRGHHYGRSVVAGSLQTARTEGASQAFLFTNQDNEPARRAYVSLGFQHIGDYALILFAPDR